MKINGNRTSVKVLAFKHVSSIFSITQCANIGRQFITLKASSKTTTVTNLPHGFGLKCYLEDTFDNLKASGTLTLKLPARKVIIDHIVSCPEIFGKAMIPKATKR